MGNIIRRPANYLKVTEAKIQQPGFALNPHKMFRNKKINITIPAESISVLTTLDLEQKDSGVIE